MLKTGPSFVFTVFPRFIVFFGIFENTNSVTLCQNSVFAKFWGCQKWGFRKENCIFCFFFLCWSNRNRKNMEKTPKPYKNSVFKWSSKNVKNQKQWILFCKNCLTLFVSGREKKRVFSCTLSVLAKKVFGPKQRKPGNAIKIVVSAEIAQNQKWHLFWKKVFFELGEKVGFTNCVFEKLCFLFFWNNSYSVFRETQQLQYKHCM